MAFDGRGRALNEPASSAIVLCPISRRSSSSRALAPRMEVVPEERRTRSPRS